MSFFGSKKVERPQIPPVPTLPPIVHEEKVPSELPSIVTGKSSARFNEDMIKSAVSDGRLSGLGSSSEGVDLYATQDGAMGKNAVGDVFVQVEKFKKAQDSLEDVDEKIRSLYAEIEKLKEVKNREIEELTAWEGELKKIASGLSSIDSALFGEV